MKNDVINLKSKIILLVAEKTWKKLLHAWCSILSVVSKPLKQIGGLGKLNTVLVVYRVFLLRLSQLGLISFCAFM